jgi:hypothetical protein
VATIVHGSRHHGSPAGSTTCDANVVNPECVVDSPTQRLTRQTIASQTVSALEVIGDITK